MDNIVEFLSRFEDFGLAFFYKYRLDTYIEETQDKIMAYLRYRNLDQEKINLLIDEYTHTSFSDDELRCPRCKSKKLISNLQESFNYLNKINYNLAEELIDYKDPTSRDVIFSCEVCDFTFSPRKNYSVIRKILNMILHLIIPARYRF